VSEGGIRLLLHSDCPIGTILKLSFRLPKKNALTSVYAQARWKRDNWMGFQFLVLGKGDQEQIRQYAKKLDPSKPHQR
jgi:hypothetical protein